MADRAQVSKLVPYVVTGKEDVARVSKFVVYLVLEPTGIPEDLNAQGHVYSRRVKG